jgi:hypothetical protein
VLRVDGGLRGRGSRRIDSCRLLGHGAEQSTRRLPTPGPDGSRRKYSAKTAPRLTFIN